MTSSASVPVSPPVTALSQITLPNESFDTMEKVITQADIPLSVSGTTTTPTTQMLKDPQDRMLSLFTPNEIHKSDTTGEQSRSVPVPLSSRESNIKSCWLRPCKVSNFIRSSFEEAALRYAAKQRWLALFPETSKASDQAPTTSSVSPKPTLKGR